MTSKDAIETHTKKVSEARTVAYNFEPELESGESLTGTPTIEGSPSGLTISNVGLNSAATTISGRPVAANQAVMGKVSGGAAGTTYTLKVTATTDGSPAQTIIRDASLVVEAD